MEESSSAAQSRAPSSNQKPPIAVPKFCQNKEFKDAKKAFEARLWAAVKCTQSYSGGTSGTTGTKVCKVIDSFSNGTDVLDQIFAGISVYYNYTGEEKCFDVNDDPHGENGWNWQACTEMVMPMSSNPESSIFPKFTFDIKSYTQDCLNMFGVEPRPHWITTEFGGHDIKRVLKNYGSNIIFSNGLLDPWSGGGVLQNISNSVVALVTELGAHHLDLRAATGNDPSWLVEQRNAELQIISTWINEYYQDKGIYAFEI